MLSLLWCFVSVRALKGQMGKDNEISAPIGITVTADDGKILGMWNAFAEQILWYNVFALYWCWQRPNIVSSFCEMNCNHSQVMSIQCKITARRFNCTLLCHFAALSCLFFLTSRRTEHWGWSSDGGQRRSRRNHVHGVWAQQGPGKTHTTGPETHCWRWPCRVRAAEDSTHLWPPLRF